MAHVEPSARHPPAIPTPRASTLSEGRAKRGATVGAPFSALHETVTDSNDGETFGDRAGPGQPEPPPGWLMSRLEPTSTPTTMIETATIHVRVA
jgi:hypothetical protein